MFRRVSHNLTFLMKLNSCLVLYFSLLVLLMQFSGQTAFKIYCPDGCECDPPTKMKCENISYYPNLSEPNNYTDFVFRSCKFENNTMPPLPESFSNATSFVIHNCTTKIYENTFDFLTQLQNLSITRNHKLEFASSTPFRSLKTLRLLDLSGNELKKLPDNLCSGTPILGFVDASNNHLSTIPTHAFEHCFYKLEKVYLQKNDFMVVNYSSLPWSDLSDINLSQNPWNCDCKMLWVKNMRRGLFQNASCQYPQNLQGEGLYDAEVAMNCGERLPIALGIGIPILIVGLIIIGYYLYKTCKKHQTKKRLRSSVKYSSVYGETVESNSKHFILA